VKNFERRLAELERLEAAAALPAMPPPAPPVPPPTFDEVLAGFDLLIAALGDGRAMVYPTTWCWDRGVETKRYSLCGMADREVLRWGMEVDRLIHESGLAFTTAAEYVEWLREMRRPVAFLRSRTDAELDRLVTMDSLDPLFYDAEQQALAEEWARLVEQGDDGCIDAEY
jgi:hypothetical protein